MSEENTVESVWEYPRPPRLEPTASRIRVVQGGVVIADTTRAFRVLETSHPPVFYLPPTDVRLDLLRPAERRDSFCEWKGMAAYWDLEIPADEGAGGVCVPEVAWSYPRLTAGFRAIVNHLAFYASRVDECTVDGERVQAQAGDFYGGWITSRVRGPFKGAPGTRGW
jgi:uncharacterized protein (DUF427 family)